VFGAVHRAAALVRQLPRRRVRCTAKTGPQERRVKMAHGSRRRCVLGVLRDAGMASTPVTPGALGRLCAPGVADAWHSSTAADRDHVQVKNGGRSPLRQCHGVTTTRATTAAMALRGRSGDDTEPVGRAVGRHLVWSALLGAGERAAPTNRRSPARTPGLLLWP